MHHSAMMKQTTHSCSLRVCAGVLTVLRYVFSSSVDTTKVFPTPTVEGVNDALRSKGWLMVGCCFSQTLVETAEVFLLCFQAFYP